MKFECSASLAIQEEANVVAVKTAQNSSREPLCVATRPRSDFVGYCGGLRVMETPWSFKWSTVVWLPSTPSRVPYPDDAVSWA